MLEQLHAIGATVAIIVTAATFGEMPLVFALLQRFGARPFSGRGYH
jgi:hypothetical protein